MSRIVVGHRTNDRKLIRMGSQLSEMLAQLQARYLGRNRFERPSDFIGGVGLQVKRVQLARAAPHEQKDASFGRLRSNRTATFRRDASEICTSILSASEEIG